MSAYALRREHDDTLFALMALSGGGIILLLRAQALSLGPARSGAVLALYGALGVISSRMPVPRARLATATTRIVVALAGVGAVVAVAYAPWQIGPAAAYALSAVAFGTVAAVAEEAFFRRLMYGWVERWWGPFAAVAVSALAFALVHVPLYGVSVLWVDLGAGLLLSWQRWASGSWAAPTVTHVAANLLVVIR